MGLSQSHGKANAGCLCNADWPGDGKRGEAVSAKWDGRSDTWRRLSCGGAAQPEPRSGHSVERIGAFCYVFGGYNEGHCMADLWRFDLHTYAWEAIQLEERKASGQGPQDVRAPAAIPVLPQLPPQMPRPPAAALGRATVAPEGRASHASCALPTSASDGLYYIHGGSGAEWGRSSKNDLWCFQTARARWVPVKQKGTPPPPMYGHSMALHRDHTLILFGGTTGWDYFNDVYAFDVALRTWRTLPVKGAPPSMRYKHQCGIIQDGLYILGGGQFHAPDYPFDVHRLDLVTLRWEQIVAPNAPTGRLAHACTVARGHPSQFQFRREEPPRPRPRHAAKALLGLKRVRPASGSGRLRSGASPERLEGKRPAGDGEAMEVEVRARGPRSVGSSSASSHDSLDEELRGLGDLLLTDTRGAEGASKDQESDFILVFGGKDNRDRKLNDMYSFDVHARIWRCMSGPRAVAGPSAPGAGRAAELRGEGRMEARDFHCMEVVKNQIFIFGGCAGEERLNDVWRYSMRRSPPSLQMLCTRFIREQVELHDEWGMLEHVPEALRAAITNLTPASEGLDFGLSPACAVDDARNYGRRDDVSGVEAREMLPRWT